MQLGQKQAEEEEEDRERDYADKLICASVVNQLADQVVCVILCKKEIF
jgi:hypothetical protein